MCCCDKPNVNGTPGAYSWDGKSHMTREPAPPALADGDSLIHDEPGRCGGLDAHSHHFRLVKNAGRYAILVRHGGGDERIPLGCTVPMTVPALAAMDSNSRYWLFHTLYSVQRDAARSASETCSQEWKQAAAEKRIRTRRLPKRGICKVWIDPTPHKPTSAAA